MEKSILISKIMELIREFVHVYLKSRELIREFVHVYLKSTEPLDKDVN